MVRRVEFVMMTPEQRKIRMNIRKSLLDATLFDLRKERDLAKQNGDQFRAECIQELIDSFDEEREDDE
jgi:hypothetical protein